MQITQVTFIAKNVKCTSIKPKRYLVDTVDSDKALEVASQRLKLKKHYDRYIALTPIIIGVLDA